LVDEGRAALSACYKVKTFQALDAEFLSMLEDSRRLAAILTH
jgi:hypothetical protein